MVLLLLCRINAVGGHVVALRMGGRELRRVLRCLWVRMVAVELSWLSVLLLLLRPVG
jgi:hypothetical protein